MRTTTKLILTAAVLCAAMAATSQAASLSDFQAFSYTSPMGTMPYQLYVPANYDPGKQYPLTLFLHGLGEIGTDNTKQIGGNINNLLNHLKTAQYESILIAPQTPDWWYRGQSTLARDITKLVQTQYNVDPNKVFCTGLSMGGYGTWDMAARFGSDFSAFVPICGAEYPTSEASRMVDLPIWAFHAANDPTVSVDATRNMVAAIKEAGSKPKYTEYATGGHGIWGTVYNTEAMYQWLFNDPQVEYIESSIAYTKQDLGGGKFGYTFRIRNNDEKMLSYAVTLGFEGVGGATIQQVNLMGVMPVNDEATATTWDGLGAPPYSKAGDSWVCSPFNNAIPGVNPFDGTSMNGFSEGANSFAISCGTGAASQYGDNVAVAYIVADGDVHWTGTISRSSKIYQTSGFTPEPATLAMLLVGGLAAIRRNRRAA